MVLLLYSLPIMLTTTIAKKNLNCDAKKVVRCQITGKLKMTNSPNSNEKKPKTLNFIDESKITKNGKIMARTPGFNHFNSKQSRTKQLKGRKGRDLNLSNKVKRTYLATSN